METTCWLLTLAIGAADTKPPQAAERMVELTPLGVTLTRLAAPSPNLTVPLATLQVAVVCKAAVLRKADDGATNGLGTGWPGQGRAGQGQS